MIRGSAGALPSRDESDEVTSFETAPTILAEHIHGVFCSSSNSANNKREPSKQLDSGTQKHDFDSNVHRTIDPSEFLNVCLPALRKGDAEQLAQLVRVRWTERQVAQLLKRPETDVRRVAAVALGLIGELRSAPALTRALKDSDRQVNQMAEHGLWAIWFRGCNTAAALPFKQGVSLLEDENYDHAISCFHQAIKHDKEFAEAWNQCAIAHFFLAQWEQAVEACRHTLQQIPTHFGAISCMGHCYMQLGNYVLALECYQRALAINPCMPAIANAIEGLQDTLMQMNDSSGYFEFSEFSQ